MRLFLALILLLPMPATAQDGPPAEPPAEPAVAEPAAAEPAAAEPTVEELHDELRAVRAEMERALNERNLDAILARCDERVIFTPMNGEIVRGRDGVRAYYERMLLGPDAVVKSITTTFEADDLSILHDGSTAVAFGHSRGEYELNDGSEFVVDAVWVTTMLRRDGEWQIAAFSYTTSVFDNPILDLQRKYMFIGGGVAALLLGLIGLVVGWLMGRKRAAKA